MPDDDDDVGLQKLGPILIDWPRSLGYFGGVAAAIAFDLIAPELALFVAAVPLIKLLKREDASEIEKMIAGVIEGAAKPLGGDAEATVRPAWLDERKHGTQDATRRSMEDEQDFTGEASDKIEDVKDTAQSALDRMWQFARRHPALSIIGAAGIGLLGGVELAGGVLIGAGVAAALKSNATASVAEPARAVRHRARSLLARAPREVRERARAVVDAARGKMVSQQPNGTHGTRGPSV